MDLWQMWIYCGNATIPTIHHTQWARDRTSRKRRKSKLCTRPIAMHARGVGKWQSRQKISLGGPVRRACPASGATWNVQVVRGKMTSRCLWHACRALALGLVLMAVGAGMATIGMRISFFLSHLHSACFKNETIFLPSGYYAEHIATDNDTRSNSTVRKSDSKGIHLHNLSYAGPIVMGCGGKTSTPRIKKFFSLFFLL